MNDRGDVEVTAGVHLPAEVWAAEQAAATDAEDLHTRLLDHLDLDLRYWVDGDLVASTLDEDRDGDVIVSP